VPLPLKNGAPEIIEENGIKHSLIDKCSRTTGLGKRAWKIAEVLSKEADFEVTVLVPNLNYPGDEWIDTEKLFCAVEPYNFKAALWGWSEELDKRLMKSDFVIVQTATGAGFLNCSVLPGHVNVIVDGFVPIFAELPGALLGKSSVSRQITWNDFKTQYTNLLLRANCVLYATDRQYYYYEGQFFAINKLNWKAFKFSPLLKVPLGVDPVPRVSKTNSDKLRILWYGPSYPWYKPEKLLDIAPFLPNTEIDFVGMSHPRYKNAYNKFFKKFFESTSDKPNVRVVENFCDTPADLYKNYDAGIVLARDWLEEKYAVRGRVLDMLSHGLPVIMNKGNSLFMEMNYLSDSLYPTTSQTLRKDLSWFEKKKSVLAVSEKSHRLIQENLLWSTVVSPVTDYIKRFNKTNDSKQDEREFDEED
jgi:hypothetical protein